MSEPDPGQKGSQRPRLMSRSPNLICRCPIIDRSTKDKLSVGLSGSECESVDWTLASGYCRAAEIRSRYDRSGLIRSGTDFMYLSVTKTARLYTEKAPNQPHAASTRCSAIIDLPNKPKEKHLTSVIAASRHLVRDRRYLSPP